MKFTNTDAYKKIVAKLTTNGETLNLSERSINEQLEKLVPLVANDETELDSFVDSVLPFIQTANANVRTDIADGIKKYKDENPVKPNEGNHKDDDPNKALLERIAALEEENAKAKTIAKKAETKKSLLAKMKELGVKNEDWAKDMISDIEIGEDFDIEAKANHYLTLYNKYNAKTPPDVTPGGAGGAGEDKYADDVMKQAGEIVKSQTYQF